MTHTRDPVECLTIYPHSEIHRRGGFIGNDTTDQTAPNNSTSSNNTCVLFVSPPHRFNSPPQP